MRSPFYRVGAWCWIVTGVGHTVTDVALRLSPPEADREFDAVLRDHPFELMGGRTSHYDLFMGFSIAMGLAIGLVGFLLLMLDRFATKPDQKRTTGIIGLAASSGLLALSIAWMPPPPILFFSIATVAFTIAVFTLGNSSTHIPRPATLDRAGR